MNRTSRRRGGFTLFELMIALSILVISIIGLVSVITYTTTQNEINRENLLAMRAAEGKIEEMRQYLVPEIFARYSSTAWVPALYSAPNNITNPGGVFPGPDFSLALSTDPTYSRLQKVQATITFPWVNGGAFVGGLWQANPPIALLEDQNDPDPIARDLNANGVVDDPTLNYVKLPVTITIKWSGIKGNRTITYRYMFYKRS
jgi:prepilin-type N-terminal cleavage/methylation domain-containing protein